MKKSRQCGHSKKRICENQPRVIKVAINPLQIFDEYHNSQRKAVMSFAIKLTALSGSEENGSRYSRMDYVQSMEDSLLKM